MLLPSDDQADPAAFLRKPQFCRWSARGQEHKSDSIFAAIHLSSGDHLGAIRTPLACTRVGVPPAAGTVPIRRGIRDESLHFAAFDGASPDVRIPAAV